MQDPKAKRQLRREKRAAKAERAAKKAAGGHAHDHDHEHHDHSHDHDHSHGNGQAIESQERATGADAPSGAIQRRPQAATVEEGDSD